MSIFHLEKLLSEAFSKGLFSIEEQIGIFLVLEEEEEVTGRVDAAKKNSRMMK